MARAVQTLELFDFRMPLNSVSLGFMNTLTKGPRQHLLRNLFLVCEAAFVASFAASELLWNRYPRASQDAGAIFGFTFLISLAVLFGVSFCLRRRDRLLAIIGWVTAFVLFWYAVLTPEL